MALMPISWTEWKRSIRFGYVHYLSVDTGACPVTYPWMVSGPHAENGVLGGAI